jgi:hypothetical protein
MQLLRRYLFADAASNRITLHDPNIQMQLLRLESGAASPFP